MPSQAVHEEIDRIFFGKAFPEIHRDKDAPFAQLGLFHRLVRHDLTYALNCPEPAVSLVHDAADFLTLPMAPIALLVNPKLVLD